MKVQVNISMTLLLLQKLKHLSFKGVVQLSGFVDNKEISTRASEVTRTIKGVKMVNNNLIVK